jgi:hypothetical protein
MGLRGREMDGKSLTIGFAGLAALEALVDDVSKFRVAPGQGQVPCPVGCLRCLVEAGCLRIGGSKGVHQVGLLIARGKQARPFLSPGDYIKHTRSTEDFLRP